MVLTVLVLKVLKMLKVLVLRGLVLRVQGIEVLEHQALHS